MIIVYTSDNCSRCKMIKEILKSKNIPFSEKNVDDVEIMADLVMKDIVVLSTPVIQDGETFIYDFEEQVKHIDML